jgi:hypothetical protein
MNITQKEKLMRKLHESAQCFANKAHKADRNGKMVSSFINLNLYNLCYNLRDIIRSK